MKELYPVQAEHAERLMQSLDKYRAALDASQTGCGKTPVAVKIAFEYDFPTLVVAPKTAIPMWEEELENSGISTWYVINYEKLRANRTEWGNWSDKAKKIWKWNLPVDTLLIWDEVQKAKGMNTQNARLLWSAHPYRNLMLSATAAKDPTEMKALGYVLGLHRLRDFWKWSMRYGCRPGMFGGLEYDGEPEDLNRLHQEIFPKHGSRLTTSDLADHFTETQIIMTPLDFGAEVQAAYAEMDRELAALAAAKAHDSKGAEALTIRLRARQKVELLKVPDMLERTEDLVAEGRSVALFVNFTATIDALRERLSMPSGVVSGAHGDRQKHIKAFQNDTLRVIICNIQAGGMMLNLQDMHGVYPRTSLISPNDNEKDIIQVIGRIHRVSGQTPTQQHVLFAANTIEEVVKDNCLKKMGNVDIFNAGLDE